MADMFHTSHGGRHAGSRFVLWEPAAKMGSESARWFRAIESGRWDLESFVWDDNSHGPKLEL